MTCIISSDRNQPAAGRSAPDHRTTARQTDERLYTPTVSLLRSLNKGFSITTAAADGKVAIFQFALNSRTFPGCFDSLAGAYSTFSEVFIYVYLVSSTTALLALANHR